MSQAQLKKAYYEATNFLELGREECEAIIKYGTRLGIYEGCLFNFTLYKYRENYYKRGTLKE